MTESWRRTKQQVVPRSDPGLSQAEAHFYSFWWRWMPESFWFRAFIILGQNIVSRCLNVPVVGEMAPYRPKSKQFATHLVGKDLFLPPPRRQRHSPRNAMVPRLVFKSIWVIEEWEQCLLEEEDHLLNKWLQRYLHQDIELTSYHMISTLPSPCFLLSPLHLPFSFHSALYNTHSRFPVPFDVIAKTRSPWQQLVTSSSPTLSFDGCFYFGGLVDVARTSLAEHQVTCSGGGGTMLPSVGSKCLHTADQGEQQPALLWWLTTVNHMATGTPHSDSSLNTCMLTEVPLWKGQVTTGLLPLKAAGMEKYNKNMYV